jgi:hypothetical protein
LECKVGGSSPTKCIFCIKGSFFADFDGAPRPPGRVGDGMEGRGLGGGGFWRFDCGGGL